MAFAFSGALQRAAAVGRQQARALQPLGLLSGSQYALRHAASGAGRGPPVAAVAAATRATRRFASDKVFVRSGSQYALRHAASGAGRGPPVAAVAAATRATRRFASDKAGQQLMDSWVCPETLYEFAEHNSSSRDVDDEFFEEFGRRNEAWRKRMLENSPELFEMAAAGQSPKYLWIGCSDSRVAAELMIDANPGELFVHRNIANMVVNTDFNLRAVLKYAVMYLKVEHIIVCGHYDCGGVKASFVNQDHRDPLESWITNIRDVYRIHAEELDAIVDDEERHKRFVELNVIEQCLNLFKTSDVQRRRASTSQRPDLYECAFPRIHGMVFEPSDGILRALPVDFKQYIRRYQKVYRLHDPTDYRAGSDDEH